MKKLTREEFYALPENAVVHVSYTSRWITGFEQDFTRDAAQEKAVQVSQREWNALWDTYHDYEAQKVEFALAEA